MAAAESPDDLGQTLRRHLFVASQPHGALDRTLGDELDGPIVGIDDPGGVVEELSPERGENERVAVSPQQARSELLLESLHFLAHGGLRDAELRGRSGESILHDDLAKGPEGLDVQTNRPVD